MRLHSSTLLIISTTMTMMVLLTITSLPMLIFAQDDIPVSNQGGIDSAKCRLLGFASASTSAPPACGTCDVLAELLKATPSEKQLPEAQRKQNKATKKQFVSECRQCCVPGTFEEDAETTLQRGGVGAAADGRASNFNQDGLNVPNVNSRPASGSFVSAVLEVDKALAENTAHSISRFIRMYSSSWDKTKISLDFKESIPPRLHLKRPNGKVDIVNVGSWEPELIWEYLRKGLIA